MGCCGCDQGSAGWGTTTPGWLGVGSARGFAGKELAKERPFAERRDWSGGPLPPRLRVCARYRLAAGPRERKRLLVPGPQALLWLARDEQDSTRTDSPLTYDETYTVIDTSDVPIDDVVDAIVKRVRALC